MSPTRNGNTALQRFKRGNAFAIRNGTMFDFYLGLPICIYSVYIGHVIMLYTQNDILQMYV